MTSDYANISAENEKKYGTEVSYYGSDFADRYTERTHFIFELLQNAEDALRWRAESKSTEKFSRHVKFHLFPDHLEVTHFGLPFTEEHVRAICSIKRGTKQNSLTDIGKFGIGFKSVYAYTKRPEVHSGDEHFCIESYVHPRPIGARQTVEGQTFFYVPFDHDEISAEQAFAEISVRLTKLGFRSLLFLKNIESVDWEINGKASGSYIRDARVLTHHREVTLVGQIGVGKAAKPLDEQQWLVFSRVVKNAKDEPAGCVEVAYSLVKDDKTGKRSIVKAEESNLVVFFPTERETHCGFLLQGPYKTTPSRDNIPHDNKWNSGLVQETAILVCESLTKLADLKLTSVGLLEAMPLIAWQFPDDSMFRPVFEAVQKTLTEQPLIPATQGRLVSGQSARIARGKGFLDLFAPAQLQALLGSEEPLDWVSSDISADNTPELFTYLTNVLDIPVITPVDLPDHLLEEFFRAQKATWLIRFYTFLLDHERLWRLEKPRGALLLKPIIRLQDETHVAPYKANGAPNVYLPGDTESAFPTVHRLIARHKKAGEFFRKIKLTEPDVTSEVLQKVVPQYEADHIDIPDKKHLTNLNKILRALGTESLSRAILVQKLKELPILSADNPATGESFLKKPNEVYFKTRSLETYFETHKDVWFLSEPGELFRREKIQALLKELGMEDKPRRIAITTDCDLEKRREIRGQAGHTKDLYFLEYDLEGLATFFKSFKKVDFGEATRQARILWEFLVAHVTGHPPGKEMLFFQGEYAWKYWRDFHRHFDAHFLTVLRAQRWVPGKDGQLHKPSELMPQELASGFARNPTLCEALQMKAEVLVNLAKEAGLRVEDLMFIRQHREEFEKLKRTVKDKPAAAAMPAEQPLPATPKPTLNPTIPPAGSQSAASLPPSSAAATTPPASPQDLDCVASPTEASEPSPIPPSPSNPDTNDPQLTQGTTPLATNGREGNGGLGQGDGEVGRGSAGGGSNTPQPRRGKLRSYVVKDPTPSDDAPDTSQQEQRLAVGEAGVAKVADFERGLGCDPKIMPHQHPGYDIESRDPASGTILRYIEVKSLSGSWGEDGVGLTATEFLKAQELGDIYWLYVVENAEQPDARIHCIQNPAGKVDQFLYDNGWQQAKAQDPRSLRPPEDW